MENKLLNKMNSLKITGTNNSLKNEDSAAPVEKKEEPERVKITNFSEEIKKKDNYSGMDIVFVLDSTGSMGPYIQGAKESLKTIIEDSKQSLKEIDADESSLRFAVISYRDHPPQDQTYVTQVCDFCSSDEAEAFIQKIRAEGGGDLAEAVLDGLDGALNQVSWRTDSDKFLFLVLDAPPHGKRFATNESDDDFPEGCPCGLSEVTLLNQIRSMNIDFTIIKVDSRIEKMIEIFSQYTNLEVFFPKLFQEKEKNRRKGDFLNSVRMEMKNTCNSKLVSNLHTYKK